MTPPHVSANRSVAGFDTFVVGAANRLAVAAARAVSESPGVVYNPLFVYGDSGLGKTHMLDGIAKLAAELQPGLTVRYAALVDVVDSYHTAVAEGTTDAWAASWQDADIVLIDDIQFLTGRRETQNELLRLFTWMQQHDRQIVLTSDRPPNEIADVDARLIARLGGGLVVDIGVPDFETRAAILRSAAALRGYDVEETLLHELARVEFSNVREMQGALHRLVAHRALTGSELRVEDVARSLGLDPPGAGARRSVQDFQNYLAGVTAPITRTSDTWRARIAEVIAIARTEGFETRVLERVLSGDKPEDVDGVIDGFQNALEHLRTLERAAIAIDGALAGHPTFRDPEFLDRAEALLQRAISGNLPPEGPSPMYARALFERSTSNDLAVRAVDTVVNAPGAVFNPLFIHGPSGVGKTHLAHAVGNELLARSGGQFSVACVPAMRFVEELISSMSAGTEDHWRARYRNVDALIIDDVHALTGKERTQEELFHVFNALQSAGRQMVFTSDQMPRAIPGLEDRLRTRFEGGLVVPIGVPDRTLRERVVALTLRQRGRPADAELVRVIADQPVRGVRELIALVHRLIGSADTHQTGLTAGFVRGEAGGSPATPVRPSMRAVDSAFLDTEKIVWEWPDATSRLIEELR